MNDRADFKQQIEEHRGMHGTECSFVPCTCEHPDFKSFSEDQLRYYLYFRDCFFEGKHIETEAGYAWLLLVELINTRDRPEETMERLLRFTEFCQTNKRKLFSTFIDSLDTPFSYAIANGLDLPRVRASEGPWESILISELLLPMPERVSDDMIGILVDRDSLQYENPDPHLIEPGGLFSAALPEVDAEMRMRTGKGILETYGTERTDPVLLYSRYGRIRVPYFGDTECVISYTEAQPVLKTFLGGMLRYCQQVMERNAGKGKGPSVPAIFGKEWRKAVDRVFNDGGIIRPQYRPKTVRGSVRIFDLDEVDAPILADSTGFSDREPPSYFGPDMVRYSKTESPGERRYIPSGFKRPDYRCLSAESREYYLWWRECARKGKYGVTDEGYLWLYRCELINAYEDRRYVLDQLAGLTRAYDRYLSSNPYERTEKTGRTYLNYAVMNCPHLLDPTVHICPISAGYVLDRLLEGDADVPVSAAIMLEASGIGKRKTDVQIAASFDDDCAHIAARVLARLYGSGEGCGGARGYCSVRYTSVHEKAFRGLKYHHWPDGKKKLQSYRMLDLEESPRFCTEMRILVKAVIAAVGDRENPREGRPKTAFGVKLDGILQEETDRWFFEKAMRAARDFAIDRSKVERAQTDLDRVTSIMCTEEDAGPAKRPSPKPAAEASVPDDPWQAFAAGLDKEQREYLMKALAGTLRSLKPMIEDSINAIAMDTVKDTVLENRKVFDEYADDIRKGLVFDDDRDP